MVVDVETTGLRVEDGAQVTEIAHYDIASGVLGSFIPAHTLERADAFALEVSRYEERIAGRSQDDGTLVRELHQYLGGDGVRTHLVGSNPGFDAGHLNALFAKYDLAASPWHHRLIDPCAAAYWLHPEAGLGASTGLKEAAALTGVPLDGHHAATVDVQATAGVWYALEADREDLALSRQFNGNVEGVA